MSARQGLVAESARSARGFDRLLRLLGYDDADQIVLCGNHTGTFASERVTGVQAAQARLDGPIGEGDVWFAVNPVSDVSAGRGKTEDVTGLTALYCDLDYKADGARDEATARSIVADLSAILGEPPTAIVHTGHGQQPYWPVKGCDTLDEARLALTRWRVLVETVATAHDASVDNVFDAARVLRVPGTVNRKAEPVPVSAEFDEDAGTLTLDQVHESFDAYGLPMPTLDEVGRAPVLPEAGWPTATATCPYVVSMVNGWKDDAPKKGRHPWALSQAVRLACALRQGCVTVEHAQVALGVLTKRYATLCREGIGGERREPDSVAGKWRWAITLTEQKTDDEVSRELGDHIHEPSNAGSLPLPDAERVTVAEAKATFTRWLGASYDTDAMLACASIAACLYLDGDTPWLLVVSGSGFTKTETVSALAGMGAHITSTITSEGALLSATSRRERSPNATGGLLRTVGDAGVLVIKDVTSILSMGRELRASVLAALREVADGLWERNVGTDGGQTLTWSGRCVTVGAVTTAWDKHYQVVAEMGDRFLLVRMDSNNADSRGSAGRQSLRMTSRETDMRGELRGAIAGLLAGMDAERCDALTDAEEDLLVSVADHVARCRTAVERDYQGKPEWAHALEAPTRLAKYLWQMVRGALAIGVGRDEALRLAVRVAGDSMPQVRLDVLLKVQEVPEQTSWQYAKLLQLPRTTVDRTLQELHLLGAVEVSVSEEVDAASGKRKPWVYSVSGQIDESVLDLLADRKKKRPEKSVGPLPQSECVPEGDSEEVGLCPPTDTSGRSAHIGSHSAMACSGCGEPLDAIHHDLGYHPFVCAPAASGVADGSPERPF